ncbi:uncharacterized protein EAF02_000107 [Botrytis sinoallii]|uniref:uncharacterized protein n=1 Tax=Botrytis sinoallii TaxID=1463999 RepID=UPI001900DE20|nr:uncharacterized protein EAF02_000107 [Botrytis sinoallii]KAF7892569.1 hypothetical protein EAF02_000107 [Botrytis sinoallii]
MLRKRVVDEWVENQPTIKELRRHPLDYHTPDGVTLKNELRRLRLLGSRALDAAARDEFKINRTVEEIAARRSELRKASNLMNIISIRAQRMKATHANESIPDIEDDTIADHNSGIVQVQRVGEDVDYDASLPIHYLVLGFMEHLLEPRTPPGQPRKCPLCQVDEYVSVEHKAKLWANLALMTRHLDGTFHNGYNTWLRKYQEENLTKSGFPCPYGCGKSYKDLRGLIKHITTPIKNDSPEDKQHHELVKEDGWFRDDWKEDGMDSVKRESKRSYARDNWRCKRAIDSGLTTPHPPAKYLRTGEYITIEQPAPGMLHNQLVEYGRRDGYLSDLNIELSQMMPQPTVSLQAQLQYMQSHSPLRQQLPLSKELEVLKDRYQGVVANSVPIETLDCKRLGAGKL